MNHKYIQIEFQNISSAQADILIAELSVIGFEGFEEVEKTLWAYIPSTDFDEGYVKEIAAFHHLIYKQSVIEETNWNAVWKANFEPIVINDFAGIRADFHPPIQTVEHEIIITPKMSFGTGHHATTYMMIQQMQGIAIRHKTVFDFGTGTGILAILAEKMEAKEIKAIDNDDWCITNAAENIEFNQCQKILLEKADTPSGDSVYEVILANINKNIILENFSRLVNLLTSNGTLLLSGLLEADEDEIIAQAQSLSIKSSHKIIKDKWICLRFSR